MKALSSRQCLIELSLKRDTTKRQAALVVYYTVN
jgi:hypothetical protein